MPFLLLRHWSSQVQWFALRSRLTGVVEDSCWQVSALDGRASSARYLRPSTPLAIRPCKVYSALSRGMSARDACWARAHAQDQEGLAQFAIRPTSKVVRDEIGTRHLFPSTKMLDELFGLILPISPSTCRGVAEAPNRACDAMRCLRACWEIVGLLI
jgi:hypothetical protein